MNNQKNVHGTPLQPCSFHPKTGFIRDGFCTCIENDPGKHTICVVLTDEFLDFSKQVGNNLSDPVPAYGFPGLNAGDQWCLCLSRWVQAFENGCAPHVILEATNESVLTEVPLSTLESFEL